METKLLKSTGQLTNSKFAIGNDLVHVPDFKHSLTDEFKKKVFTNTETAYCELFDDALLRYASTWAAKEAVYKAIKQIYPLTLPFKKIEITRSKIAGKPGVTIGDPRFEDLNISLTISHDGAYAWAIAMIEIR